MAVAASAAITAYCHPNRIWAASRKTNASDTLRAPCSSSGTGLNSAARAASAKTQTPARASMAGGDAAAVRAAPTATGTVTAMTVTT